MSRSTTTESKLEMSKSLSSLPHSNISHFQAGVDTLKRARKGEMRIQNALERAHRMYNAGQYKEALVSCEESYDIDAFRTDNLLLLGAIHFQLRNFSESIFYNQQCIRVDPSYAEAFSNLGNALKELGDIQAAIQFYMKAIKLKPRFGDAYNNLASAYMQLGQLQEAMETYRMAIVLNPGLVDAHSNMGNLHKATGDLESAKRCYLEAIRIRPEFAIAWSNLAGVFKDEGQLKTAIAYYQEAIRLCPEFADAHSNLGNVLKECNDLEEAISAYQTAIKLRPDFAIAHGNLGSCYYDKRDMDGAIRAFKYAIQLEPNYPDAYNNLGNALRETGELDEAVQCYRSALRLKPDHPHAYNNLGNAMKDKGLIQEAIHCYVTAVRLMPKFAAAHSNLGSVLKEQGKLDQALAHYQEAISIDPNFSDAYSNMGNTYKDLCNPEQAIQCYMKAIDLSPKFADAHCNLGSVYRDGGQIVQAIESYRRALQLRPNFPDAFANLVHTQLSVCDWSSYDEDFNKLREITREQLEAEGKNISLLPSVQPFHTLVYPFSLGEMQQISRLYAAKTRMNASLVDISGVFLQKPSTARIKIGYVSSDFGNHPLGHLMQSVFGLHDRSKFEIICYSLSPSDQSTWRRKIEADVDSFKDVCEMHFGDAVNLIRGDRVHVLFNLNGYTKGAKNEIFALRPAPIQISFLGFCGTMGANYMEYMVADNTVIPPELRSYYDEKLIQLPHSYFVNDHKQSARFILDGSRAVKRAQYGIEEDKFVFCCFNQLYKIDPTLFDTWVRILKRVPNSILWLLRFPSTGEENIFNEARKRGLRHDQIVFSDVAPKEEHLARCVLADLCLDTVAYNAHTTACDVLWAGTPMITCPGDKMSTRVASSILKSCGLESLICPSLAVYEEMAVTLAQDTDKLYEMRLHLENSRDNCALFDTCRWVRNLEKGVIAAWELYEKGHLPDDISVTDTDPVVEVKEEELLS
mmetsp:Transcript_12973/g.19544  ORF Transcript_12973/g.19544 Transcript_12973/m.19544 type:complete len:972 (-) Transcript_12973:253-3168(-)